MIFGRAGTALKVIGLIGLASLPRLNNARSVNPLLKWTLASQGGDSASSLSSAVAEKNHTTFHLQAALMQAYSPTTTITHQ